MTIRFNSQLNPAPYRTADHVKFHIQKRFETAGVACCGGIFPPDRYAVFSENFVYRLDMVNQCKCCLAEIERDHIASINLALENCFTRDLSH